MFMLCRAPRVPCSLVPMGPLADDPTVIAVRS